MVSKVKKSSILIVHSVSLQNFKKGGIWEEKQVFVDSLKKTLNVVDAKYIVVEECHHQ